MEIQSVGINCQKTNNKPSFGLTRINGIKCEQKEGLRELQDFAINKIQGLKGLHDNEIYTYGSHQDFFASDRILFFTNIGTPNEKIKYHDIKGNCLEFEHSPEDTSDVGKWFTEVKRVLGIEIKSKIKKRFPPSLFEKIM